MRISDAGEGTTKDWPARRGDLDLQHIYIQGLTVAAGRVERGEELCCLEISLASLNHAFCLQHSCLPVFTLFVLYLSMSYTNFTNLGAAVSLKGACPNF